jgi:hypothetical protein
LASAVISSFGHPRSILNYGVVVVRVLTQTMFMFLWGYFCFVLYIGIVETGLFVGMAKVAYFGSADGSVKTVQSN